MTEYARQPILPLNLTQLTPHLKALSKKPR